MSGADFPDCIKQFDSNLQTLLNNYWSQWTAACEQHAIDSNIIPANRLLHVCACSDFIARSLIQKPALAEKLTAGSDLQTDRSAEQYCQLLQEKTQNFLNDNVLMTELRQFRQYEMVRIAWRDLEGLSDTTQTLNELSWLADACIQIPLETLYQDNCEKMGVPQSSRGEAIRPMVMGMGKLGANELNFSSDIDLIFFYSEQGEIAGKRSMANSEFLTRLMQRFVTVLNKVTADGFVFRVDTRLRPFGDSGPLLMNFAGVENYYQTQGRSWERYAMIKARVIYGDEQDKNELINLLTPFVFRRYLDFGAFASIRKMKALIANEISSKGLQHNIKLGEGGIREIEFIGQAFQLIRGGREPELQVRGIIDVLKLLAELKDLPAQTVEHLIESYGFLRKLENRLQMLGDEQTHTLPTDELTRARICHAMDFESWDELETVCWQHRRRVHGYFEMVFAAPQIDEDKNDDDFYHRLWIGLLDEEEVLEQLTNRGFYQAKLIWKQTREFAGAHVIHHIGDTARKRLDQLMPMVLSSLENQKNAEHVLERVLEVIQAVIRRSVYLALLIEYPMALSQLIKLCAASQLITRLMSKYPILLDDLLDPVRLYQLPDRMEMERLLDISASRYDEDDLEQQMDVLRHFQHSQILRIAALDVAGDIDVFDISSQLSQLAELLLHRVYQMAWIDMSRKHGRPVCELEDDSTYYPQLAIIAYGKLGGQELGYGSDLDIVFLHDSSGKKQQTDGERSIDNSVFFARMTQRIIHILSSYTNAGRLYEVDTRLRPDGAKGLLVSSLASFEQYQKNQAWTWEHQALLRARIVVTNTKISTEFDRIRRAVLSMERESEALKQEVREMRLKMRQHLGSKTGQELFHLKQDAGGLVDIEFIVQFMVLAHAAHHPGLLDKQSTIELIDLLAHYQVWDRQRADCLISCYRQYRDLSHQRALDESDLLFAESEVDECRQQICAIWHEVLEEQV